MVPGDNQLVLKAEALCQIVEHHLNQTQPTDHGRIRVTFVDIDEEENVVRFRVTTDVEVEP